MRVLCLVLLLCSLMLHSSRAHAQDIAIPTLTVMADSSLRVPITLLARHYALAHNLSLSTVFGSTADHIAKIEEGAEAHILITASPEWMDEVQQKGLMDVYSRTTLARNRLVLAGSDFQLRMIDMESAKTLADFTDHPADFTFALADARTSAEGKYAIAALKSYPLDALLKSHTVLFQSIYDVIDNIHTYQSLGMVFRSDALLFADLKEIDAIPLTRYPPILYQGAVIAGDEMAQAREFLKYLTSTEAVKVFHDFGFDPA
jgi:molybdate transport system substrate-binding protein